MKKFLIFLVSIVVVVSIGLTTYYFLRNDESISITNQEIYCNAGDVISLDRLGIVIKKPYRKTKFDYNAGGEDVTKYIEYKQGQNCYYVSKDFGGEINLVISTNNKNYPSFNVLIHVGNGTKENPYYIFNETNLKEIGNSYSLNGYYVQMDDIDLTNSFQSIGYNSAMSTWTGFGGNYDGAGYSISGLNLAGDLSNAGLFSSISSTGVVKNLTVKNANITGCFANAGVLAGKIDGTISRVVVEDSNITNIANSAKVGAICGSYSGKEMSLSYAQNVNISVKGKNNIIGGLVGKLDLTKAQATYANNVVINTNENANIVGGYAGEFVIGTNSGSIQQSYANVSLNLDSNKVSDNTFGLFVGKVSENSDFDITKANALNHFVGNFVITDKICDDKDLVADYNTELFLNPEGSIFYDLEQALYLIRPYSLSNISVGTKYVWYALDKDNITVWDTKQTWIMSESGLPYLNLNTNANIDVESTYFLTRSLDKIEISATKFIEMLKQGIKDKNISVAKESVIELTNWQAVNLENSVVNGNGSTIYITHTQKDSEDYASIFNKIENSAFLNFNIIVKDVTIDVKNVTGLAKTINSNSSIATSAISNVNITFENVSSNVTNVIGLADSLNPANITNCSVNIDATSKNIENIYGYTSSNEAIISNSTANIIADSNKTITAVALLNLKTIEADVTITINGNKKLDLVIGGIAINNAGTIQHSKVNVNANILTANDVKFGGVATYNNGSILTTIVSGDKLYIKDATTARLGGITDTNDGIISECNVKNIEMGNSEQATSSYVGGIAVTNNKDIEKVLMSADIYGNWVGGICVDMGKTTTATVDQVVIGKDQNSNVYFIQNTIKGHAYSAGLVVDFRKGSITNVQAVSSIVGGNNETRSSLITLVFTNGANIKNCAINSSIGGSGTKYREVFTDFASYEKKSDFGLSNVGSRDSRFNLYSINANHGCMQSVVVNLKEGVNNANASAPNVSVFTTDYDAEDPNSSYVRYVSDFNNVAQFQGTYNYTYRASWFGNKTISKRLTFEIGADKVWKSNGYSIYLAFIENLSK